MTSLGKAAVRAASRQLNIAKKKACNTYYFETTGPILVQQARHHRMNKKP
jgi:hypothetical protein